MQASVRAILYAILFAAFGAALAEYFPLFSDPITKNMCEPFSPCRDNAIAGYVVGGGLLGMVLGLLSSILQTQAEQREGSAQAKGSKRGLSPSDKIVLGVAALVGGVVVLGVIFAVLGHQAPAEVSRPGWSPGQTVDVEVTLVKSDRQDLACASFNDVAGKHCAFEATNKPWSRGGGVDERMILKPYTSTARAQFVAAGLWSQPALAPDKLPATRFTVACKLRVEGTLNAVGVRWEETGQWFQQEGWPAGSVSDCKIVP